MKAALFGNDFNAVLKYLKQLKASWETLRTTEALIPQSSMMMTIELACKHQELSKLLSALEGVALPEKTTDALLEKCIEGDNVDLAMRVEVLAKAHRTTLPDSTLSMLIRALANKHQHAHELVEEVVARDASDFAPELALAVLEVCESEIDVVSADLLFSKMRLKPMRVL